MSRSAGVGLLPRMRISLRQSQPAATEPGASSCGGFKVSQSGTTSTEHTPKGLAMTGKSTHSATLAAQVRPDNQHWPRPQAGLAFCGVETRDLLADLYAALST